VVPQLLQPLIAAQEELRENIKQMVPRLPEKIIADFSLAPRQAVYIIPDTASEHPQIEITSPQAEIIPQKSAVQDNPPVVTRENDLHILIERVCKKLIAEQKRFPKARAVFNAIRKRAEEFDEDCIIIKATNDTIEWKSMYGNIDTMKIASLANRISKIKPKLMKNNHR